MVWIADNQIEVTAINDDTFDLWMGGIACQLNRADADALIVALARPESMADALDAIQNGQRKALNGIVRGVVDAAGRIIAPAQHEPPARPAGVWDGNADARRPLNDTGE